VGEFDSFATTDCHFSYLPLPHIFERIVQTAVFSFGAAVGFFQGDALKVTQKKHARRDPSFLLCVCFFFFGGGGGCG